LFYEDTQDGKVWRLVVTPSCDLEHDKADLVILAACRPVDDDERIQAWRERDSNATRNQVRALVGHKTGGKDDRYLFLPAAPTIPDLVVDFQRLEARPRSELDAMVRTASLVSPFAEAVVARFVRYFGRVGTDDLDVDAIMDRLKSEAPESPKN
jgi:hypothetical protein